MYVKYFGQQRAGYLRCGRSVLVRVGLVLEAFAWMRNATINSALPRSFTQILGKVLSRSRSRCAGKGASEVAPQGAAVGARAPRAINERNTERPWVDGGVPARGARSI